MNPKLEGQGFSIFWHLAQNLSGMSGLASGYAAAGIDVELK
jgi:hypothetical protein